MKRYLLYLLLLTNSIVFAQKEMPAPVIITIDSIKYVDIPDANLQHLNTGDKKLTLKEVLKPEHDAKFAYAEGSLSDDFLELSAEWVRFVLKNPGKKDVTITFTVPRSREDIYVNTGDKKWVHYTTGKRVPWSERDGIKEIFEIPYTLKPGQEIRVYIDMGEITATNYENPAIGNYLKIVEDYYVKQHNYSEDDVLSFGFFGFMLFAIIFNLFFYYVNREKVYLVFSLLLLFSAMLLGENVLSHLLFKEHPQGYLFFMMVSITGFIIMLMHTTRFFFRININFKDWDKFLVYSSIFTGISGFLLYLGLFVNRWIVFSIFIGTVVGISALGFFVATIIMIISLLKKKDKEARLFVIAAVPFLVSPVLALILQSEWTITLSGMWTIMVLSWGMFARFKGLQIENARVALEKEEERNRLIAIQKEELEIQVAERTAELQQSLESLKQTQNQLIQSEKMASLGELTAGIAHEIQNPLNFVNNFSDVSIELLDEMAEELDKGDADEAKAIAGDIKQNLEKIAHHGRRADGIVKGMLQHSRASSGHKEPTDINALADEYLRLAYHGLRAKDKSFNADLVTHFSEGLPKVSVIPQDMGRVLLNLFTNAFYATQEKSKQPQASGYKPVVEVSTELKGNTVEITVKDNGTGIPDAIKDKILQPFFTTKPTGEGTGLGLSLSHDIVVKGHAGSINIISHEQTGAAFIITLPV